MKHNNYDKKIEIFKALSNPMRLEIIEILANGEKCVCEIVKSLNYEQSHISKGLIKLKEAGIIKDRKEGLKVYYSIKCKCINSFLECIDELL